MVIGGRRTLPEQAWTSIAAPGLHGAYVAIEGSASLAQKQSSLFDLLTVSKRSGEVLTADDQSLMSTFPALY